MKLVVRCTDGDLVDQARSMTYQRHFVPVRECPACLKTTTLMMLINDDEGLVSSQERPEGARIWPHDCMAIALYLCTSCGVMSASWNQA